MGTTIRCPKQANQQEPKGCYVYAHCDAEGHVFYIGKGSGKRAWSKDHHPLWTRYVEKHLGGKYDVRILAENLTEEEANEMEPAFMREYSNLINWQNFGRTIDYKRAWECVDCQKANQVLIQQAKAMEKSNLESAIDLYVKAIENVKCRKRKKPNWGTAENRKGSRRWIVSRCAS